jgi:hypothetical protein
MNKLVGITLGAAAVYGMIRLLRMQNVGDQTNITMVNPRVHAVNLGGLSFRTELLILQIHLNYKPLTVWVILVL